MSLQRGRVTDAVDRQMPRRNPSPILISAQMRTLLVFLGLVLLLLFVRAAPSIPMILLGGAAFALLLSYPVRLLSRFLPRRLAILVTLLGLMLLFVIALLVLVPMLIEQLTGLVDVLPSLAARSDQVLLELLEPLHTRNLLPGEPEAVLEGIRQDIFNRGQSLAQAAATGLLASISSTFGIGVRLFGMIFVAVYLLVDIRRTKAAYLRLTPYRYRRDARDLWTAFSRTLSRYLAGILLSITIQGALVGLALRFLEVPYAVLLRVWVTMTAIIPNLGSVLGAIPAVILAFFVSPVTAILTLLVYVMIQQLESSVLTPRIQGQAVQVHPVLILLGVFGGFEAFGLLGAVFAVPTLAVLRVLVDFARARVSVSP